MTLRKRLANLPVGQKLLAALLVLLAAVLLIANIAFISSAYWITQQSVAPQAMHTLGRLIASPQLAKQALASPQSALSTLQLLDEYTPLRAAVIYNDNGQRLAQLHRGIKLALPQTLDDLPHWSQHAFRTHLLVALEAGDNQRGHLLLVASSELPSAFYTGTLTASLAILALSVALWLVIARQIRKLITKPIRRLEELSRQVTREENYALRATPINQDEIGHLAEAFNTMLTRIQAREQQLRQAHSEVQDAFDQAHSQAEQTRQSNRQLELEVQVRSKIEKKLTGFQNYLNSIIDSMPSALIALDEQLYVTQWNSGASSLCGTSLKNALNQPLFVAFPSLRPFLPLIQRSAHNAQVEKVERITWLQGDEPHHYALTVYPLGGGGRDVVIRIDDITQRLNLEDIMVQSEKMLSVGSLAAGMAHEINNPLGAILHNVQNIRRRVSDQLPINLDYAEHAGVDLAAIERYLKAREIPRLLDDIQHAGQRAANIVTHMLSFSRRSNRQLSPCDVPTLVEQALLIAGNDFGLTEAFDFKALEIIRDFDPDLGPVPAIANELEQVLLNLMKNAAQAIHYNVHAQAPGRITLRTRKLGHYAQIQIEDNGAGMSEAVRKRVFEPFFTTKEVGQGTGLGLAVSYFIITNNHKGQMDVQSIAGQGTCFTLRLPLQAPLDSTTGS